MKFIENLTCGDIECHFNHDNYCYREEVILDVGATCESFENCEMHNCNECEFFDICSKEKKYNSATFLDDELFPEE